MRFRGYGRGCTLVLLLAAGGLWACGERPPSKQLPTGLPAGDRELVVDPEPLPLPISDEQVDRAWDGLAAKDMQTRHAAVALLLRAGVAPKDVLHLLLRHVKWGRDEGALAQLIDTYPEPYFGLLLDRISHSAPMHKAEICQALAHVRRERERTAALLIVRALLDAEPAVRRTARDALAAVHPPAVAVVD